MILRCSRCRQTTWVDEPTPNAYRVDTGCPCGKDFVLHCQRGRVVKAEGCRVVKERRNDCDSSS